ncbi:Uncharacterized protein TCM_042399 [Theobroma cacao]|uniref:Uncharacterized protein n=1 Tax=Theobroma cacao TaxID=3641 RepID=A0A061FJV3_THECC|nr:Uncharacterized protein TCM_042399 [Theobroma cacao]
MRIKSFELLSLYIERKEDLACERIDENFYRFASELPTKPLVLDENKANLNDEALGAHRSRKKRGNTAYHQIPRQEMIYCFKDARGLMGMARDDFMVGKTHKEKRMMKRTGPRASSFCA